MTKIYIFFTGISGYIISIWVLLAIVLWLLQFTVMLTGFFTFTLGLLLYPGIFRLKKYRCSGSCALVLTWLGFVALMALMRIVMSQAAQKENEFAQQLHQADHQAGAGLKKPGLFFRSHDRPLSEAEVILSQYLDNFRGQARELPARMPRSVFHLTVLALSVLFCLVLAHFGKRTFIRMLPNAWLEKGMYLWSTSLKELGLYVSIAFVQIALTFAMVAFALYLLKIPYFFTWALLAALATLIPFYLGLVFGMIPPILTVYMGNMPIIEIGGILITFAVLNLFLRLISLRQPKVNPLQLKFYELPFLLVIGWQVAQLGGLLLAVPVATMLKIIRNHAMRVLARQPTFQL